MATSREKFLKDIKTLQNSPDNPFGDMSDEQFSEAFDLLEVKAKPSKALNLLYLMHTDKPLADGVDPLIELLRINDFTETGAKQFAKVCRENAHFADVELVDIVCPRVGAGFVVRKALDLLLETRAE